MPKYKSIDTIPAKVFFEILKSKNYQLLKPKPKEQGLEQVFISIYDDFFVQSDNVESKRYLDLINDITFLEHKINVLKLNLKFYFYNRTTKEMRQEFAKALKTGYKIDLDLSVPFADEVQRVLNIEIGIINNDLEIAKLELTKLQKKAQNIDYNYYEQIGILSNVLPNNSLLREDMSLAIYIELEKLAKKNVELQNKKK